MVMGVRRGRRRCLFVSVTHSVTVRPCRYHLFLGVISTCDAVSKREIGKEPVVSRVCRCQCGRPVFFRNSRCLNCGAPLGYEPHLGRVMALESVPGDAWRVEGQEGEGKTYYRCDNLYSPAACNWLAQVRHRRAGKSAKPLRISSGDCRVYTTFAILLEPIREGQPELLQ
ncbi:MAG TPA: zinc-ribbon domain-containing protein, partial [Bryobacteraceae bacterium]